MIRKRLFHGLAVVAAACIFAAITSAQYFPDGGSWQSKKPSEAGFDAQKLDQAIGLAKSSESKAPRDQELGQAQTFGREPLGEAIGPFKTRGQMTGIVVKNGYLVAEWGEPDRVDMTHSVTKSFLTVTVGIAYDSGAIKNLDSPVFGSMAPISVLSDYKEFDRGEEFGSNRFFELFGTEHNRKITWDHLLRQTSDWEGTLWGKPEWADRPDRDTSTWLSRDRKEPGTAWEYNDVRVNVLALAALNVLRRPLPEVLRERVLDPIGASSTWRWHGYENSFVLIDGRPVQSVSGGGHWGGGMFISARDMARFGLLVARGGKWKEKQIISEQFLKRAETPTGVQANYGYMNFFLNTDRKQYPGVPEKTIAFLGNGTNLVFIDRELDLVVVARWIENSRINDFLTAVYESIDNTSREAK
ncbi:MAG: class A beta-lactamase-related serine hydrolase [Acidobacteria bacterium]|nr:MAG: class A beta-lactamase-related serine hydrolase [Acidobacteriota bacterium]REJ98912.1 MAG: class A beta-lactamase-related serine hydrolase [Acidobacteriota bacterium]REK16369.1 MAG: class A beta-lactamase-related serine hydrolase [Acidobacteriota bacterium]REK44050.1 MAG: class A beta-lactamase-related serine hydrolase [Acidobacteriota bacterium]